LGQEKRITSLKPLSGATPFNESQRLKLISNLMNKTSKSTPIASRNELLSTFLNDTANLSQFVRYAGLSEEMRAALLADARNSVMQTTRLSSRSMGEIDAMLSKIRPAISAVDGSYGAVASFGDMGSEPLLRKSSPHKTYNASGAGSNGTAGEILFKPFLPDQSDFDKTIDNMGLNTGGNEPLRTSFNLADIPVVKTQWGGVGLASGSLCLIVAGLAGALLFGFFALLN
jgi:hypothetical protein